MEQMKFPEFVEIPIWIKSGETENKVVQMKMNPMYAMFYYSIKQKVSDDKWVDATLLKVSGDTFVIDMTYDEFDEFWQEVKRSFNLEEPLF